MGKKWLYNNRTQIISLILSLIISRIMSLIISLFISLVIIISHYNGYNEWKCSRLLVPFHENLLWEWWHNTPINPCGDFLGGTQRYTKRTSTSIKIVHVQLEHVNQMKGNPITSYYYPMSHYTHYTPISIPLFIYIYIYIPMIFPLNLIKPLFLEGFQRSFC